MPHVLVLTETHRQVGGGDVRDYTTFAGMQNVDLYPGHLLSGGQCECGGVALLVRSL